MKRIYSFITSLPVMSFLFLAIAFAMAAATFIESSYGTPAARSLIYRSWWFELLWALFALNLVNNFFRYKLYHRQKWTLGIFHVSFLLILLGGAITRYVSYEGVMHIRENSASNQILSTDDYFHASYSGKEVEKKVIFSEFTPKEFSAKFQEGSHSFKVKSVGYIQNAERKPVEGEDGSPAIDFVFAVPGGQGMQSLVLTPGGGVDYMGFSTGFNKGNNSLVNFFMKGDSLFMQSDSIIGETTMGTQETVEQEAGHPIPVKKMFLYSLGDYSFLIRNFYPKAIFTAVKSQGETGEDAVIVNISDGERQKNVTVFGHSGVVGDTVRVPLSGGTLKLAYGAVAVNLPFELFLKDFQLEKYPGSESPSSYASEVELRNYQTGEKRDIRIFMNNTLKYKGFKFFQSSYDRDELGTILSVNHDFWGTTITYIGYLLMIAGFVLTMLSRKSYFALVIRKLKISRMTSVVVFVILSGISLQGMAQPGNGASLPEINDEIADDFGEIWVQGHDGRIEPLSTLSSELVRKISRKSSLYGRSSDEAFLSMMAWPDIWETLPVVKVANKEVAATLGTTSGYVSLQQLFDPHGQYRIVDQVRAAYNKAPAFRNKVEKEYINIDERVNICYMIFRGDFLMIFPSENREDSWHTPGDKTQHYTDGDSAFVEGGISLLVQTLREQNNVQATQIIDAIDRFQEKFGGTLVPSETKKNIEILYNKVNVFKRLFPFYILLGFILLVFLLVNIFKQKKLSPWIWKSFYGIILIGFLGHTAGLVARWYISGHAPWSNGYESVVYVAWAVMLAGLIFGRKYPMVVGTAAFLSGIALFVAHLSWMNPEVTNLVPVLKSYWLAIHVAIITASYGFIGLSAFLGILVMILVSLRNKSNAERITAYIDQLTSVNELAAMVGLYSLTIGTFLGGVWANESWGRYWGWDPKETWALITVMIYSFVAHMRLIPSLRGTYNYNLASVLGLLSVLMTYFGVNYFLSGLHSYGKGVAEGIHWGVFLSFGIIAAILIVAWYKDAAYEKWKDKV